MSQSHRTTWLRRYLALVVAAALFGTGLVTLGGSPAGAATRAFATRFSTNAQGDIAFVANTLLKCDVNVTGCSAALAATNGNNASFNNNNYSMIVVDTDGDSSTTNSSSANLLLPPGATVLFARLYWGAVSSAVSRGTVKFKTPSTGYATLTTTAIDDSGASAYQASIDVTAAVQAAMSGTYTVGNVALTTGGGSHAGWSMVVAYADPAGTMRNLTVFDGFQAVSGTAVTINVAGFLTPPVGPVNTQLGVVAYEGDQGTTGDQLFLNGTAMTDAVNPSNNFFNAGNTLHASSQDNYILRPHAVMRFHATNIRFCLQFANCKLQITS